VSVAAGVAAILAIVSGAFLLLAPRAVIDGPTIFRRLFFETNIGEPFGRKFAIERGIYRRHRIFGIAVILGGGVIAMFAAYLAMNPRALDIYLLVGKPGLRVAVVLAATCAVLLVTLGFCLAIRPSVLKGIEAAANRWVETKSPGPTVSAAVLRNPRLVGVLLLVGAALNLRLL
jgi:hypothetical protein